MSRAELDHNHCEMAAILEALDKAVQRGRPICASKLNTLKWRGRMALEDRKRLLQQMKEKAGA